MTPLFNWTPAKELKFHREIEDHGELAILRSFARYRLNKIRGLILTMHRGWAPRDDKITFEDLGL